MKNELVINQIGGNEKKMTHNKTLFSKELGIPGIFNLYNMTNPELIDLREKIEKILQEYEEDITQKPEEEIDFDVDLEDLEKEFADDIISTKEAALFADLFDEIGEYRNANFMDDYIHKMAEAEGDLVKQAGLFRNLLKKLIGFGKRVFFKVYRELYAKAKEAQDRLDDRIDIINETYGNIKKDLRYHDLEGWRGGIYALKLADSKDIMGDFDIAYGKLIQYLGLTGESEKSKKEKSPTGEKSQLEKLPDLSKPEEGEAGAAGTSWERMTPGAKEGWTELARSVSFSPSQGALRLDKKYFDYILGKHLSTDGAGNVRYWSSYKEQKQPMGGKLKDLMGEDEWEVKEDKDNVFLYPKSRGSEKGAPPVETPNPDEELEFESPKIPKPEGVTPLTEKKEPSLEKTLEEVPEEVFPLTKRKKAPEETPESETPEEETPESETPESETPEAPEKSPAAELVKKQSPREAVWIERMRPQRQKDGELWTRFTKVYPITAQRYERAGTGRVVQDPVISLFLDNAIPRQFPGHAANVSKLWLPTDLDKRKQYVEMAERNWAEKEEKTSSRVLKLKELYKTSMREKWLK